MTHAIGQAISRLGLSPLGSPREKMNEPPFRWASIPEPILYDGRLTHEAIRVYACLDRHANKEGVCWPSITRISKLTHISRPTVIKAIKSLEDYCFIGVQRENRKKSIYQLPNHKTKLVKLLNQIKAPTGKARLLATGKGALPEVTP